MTIPLFTVTPQRGSATFEADVQTFLSQLNAFVTAANATAGACTTSEALAAASAASSSATAYMKGAWSALTGALPMPASVSHGGTVWVLTADLADVTAATPGVSSAWVRAYPHRRIPILDPLTIGRTPIGGGEAVHNTYATTTGVTSNSGYVAANSNAWVCTASGAQSTCSQSTDGRTWTSRTLPASGTWTAVPSSGNVMLAFANSTTSGARSTDNGATWASMSLGGVTTTSVVQRLCAGNAANSKAIVHTSSLTTVVVSSDAGATWSAGQTIPATASDLYVLPNGSFVFKQTGAATVYRSTTGLTGSWTSQALPSGHDTVVQDTDGALLSYSSTDLGLDIYRSTDAATFTTLNTQRPINATPRSIAGIYLMCDTLGYGFTYHGTDWVPRRMRNDFVNRSLAVIGTKAVFALVSSPRITLYDYSAADARFGSWE